MTAENSLPIYQKDLGKWPLMVVEGDAVTTDQAAEIIVRTSGLYFSCNDREWTKQLHDAAGIRCNEKGFADWRVIQAARSRFGVLAVDYLQNDCVASCYVGGPGGWCSWAGKIGADDRNIGKWPRVEEVEKEWKTITEAFPFLQLICQLFPPQLDDSTGSNPAVEYTIGGGKVCLREPKIALRRGSLDLNVSVLSQLTGTFIERGCRIEQFRHGLELCEKRVLSK